MAKSIEARAVISAEDKTGATFDKVAKKMDNVVKSAKAFSGIKAPTFVGDFGAQVDKLKASAKEMQTIHKSWANFDRALKSNGPMRASKYLEAVDLWKSNTIGALREVKSAQDEHEKHQQRFYQRLRSHAAGAAGLIGGAYLAERVGSGAVRSAAERSREMARFSLSGMSAAEQAQAMRKADEVSAKLPSMGRTGILDHILKLRGRLGSLPHALDTVEDVSRAQVMLRTMTGGDASKDLDDLVMGLESQGVANNPAKFRSFLNSFVRAKALFPDTRGEDVREYMQRAGASRFGLSENYIKNVVPTLANHEGWSNLGVMQASAFSALIGGRQTKAAKAEMAKYGLLDHKTGEIIDKPGFIADPYQWAIGHVKDAVARKGIPMDEDHRGGLVEAVTKMFSNRKVADYFASALINQGLVEKDQKLQQGTMDIGAGSEAARRNDPFQAIGAINEQLKDAAASFLKLGPITAGINAVADKLAAAVSSFDQATPGQKAGDVIGTTLLGGGAAAVGIKGASMAYQWFTGAGALMGSATALDASAAALSAAAAELAGGKVVTDVAKTLAPGGAAAAGAGGGLLSNIWKYGAAAAPYAIPAFGVGMAGGALWDMTHQADYTGLDINSPMLQRMRGGSIRDAQRRAFNADRRRLGIPEMGDEDLLGGPEISPTMTFGTGVGGDKSITVSGSVTGEGRVVLEINAGSSLIDVVRRAEAAIQLAGQINSNGAGSAGTSSPDAASPARPSPGYGGPGL